ncbi:MAG: amidohydrolase family protein [Promethearchaeota archaeon]
MTKKNLEEQVNFLVLNNVNIIDGTGAPIKEKMSLLIKNNIIEDICPQGTLNLPPSVQNTQVQDLQGKYLLPGFIDVHIHLSFMEKIEDWLGFTDAYGTLHALNHMRNYLKVGVMSYRDVGGPVNTMIALKTAIATKKIICGRLFPCGPIITTSAGHGAEMEQTSSVNIADTPDQFRILIRKLYNKGIRHIKISPFYRLEDVKAAVDECKILDIPITSHGGGVKDTHPPTMVKIAVEGGVNCIEHIPLIGPDVLDLMKEKGTFLVPTLSVYKRLYDLEFPPILLERGWSIETQENFFKEALKLGIPIGIGTDYVESLQTHYPQCYFEEIRYLASLGMTHLEVIKAATLNGARILRKEKMLGSIEVGKLADLQVIDENPLEDLNRLGAPSIIIFDGKIIRIED